MKTTIRLKGESPAYLMTVSCIKINAESASKAFNKVKSPRSKILREFILNELGECLHPIGKVAKRLRFDRILYEVEDTFLNFNTESYYFVIKIYFQYKRKK